MMTIKTLLAVMSVLAFAAGLFLVTKEPLIGCIICFVGGILLGYSFSLDSGPDVEFPG